MQGGRGARCCAVQVCMLCRLAVAPEPPDSIAGSEDADGVAFSAAPLLGAPTSPPLPLTCDSSALHRVGGERVSGSRIRTDAMRGATPFCHPVWHSPCSDHHHAWALHLSSRLISAKPGRCSGSWAQQRCIRATYACSPSGGPLPWKPGSRSKAGRSSRPPASTVLTICGWEKVGGYACIGGPVSHASLPLGGPHSACLPGVGLVAPGHLPGQQLPQHDAKRKRV